MVEIGVKRRRAETVSGKESLDRQGGPEAGRDGDVFVFGENKDEAVEIVEDGLEGFGVAVSGSLEGGGEGGRWVCFASSNALTEALTVDLWGVDSS